MTMEPGPAQASVHKHKLNPGLQMLPPFDFVKPSKNCGKAIQEVQEDLGTISIGWFCGLKWEDIGSAMRKRKQLGELPQPTMDFKACFFGCFIWGGGGQVLLNQVVFKVWQSPCLRLLNAGMTGMNHHIWLTPEF